MSDWQDFDITSDDESLVLTWADIGEGNSGDYDASDPHDVQRLRFTVSVPGDEWNQVDDASYCTLMTPATPRELLEHLGRSILAIVQDGRYKGYKRRLEYLTWTTESEIVDAIRIQKEMSERNE